MSESSTLVNPERQVTQVNPKLVMLRGLPASGKTTYAKQLVDKGWVRVNKDDLRAMLHNSKFSKSNEAFILSLRDEIIIRALVNGNNVVVDDTNLDPKHACQFQSIAQEFMADYEEKFFDTDIMTCIERNKNRENSVPEKVIYDMYSRYLMPKLPYTVPYDDTKEECIIVDVDGTLSHISDGRSPYDASRASNDVLDDAVSSIVAMGYQNGYKVIVLTGREAKNREVTENWLIENGVPFDELYTRADGDYRKDAIVKQELYETHIKNRFNVKFVLDDRNQVVDMWREIGLKCLQVQPGDF